MPVPQPWDAYLVVEDAAIKLIDQDLIKSIVGQFNDEKPGPDGYLKLRGKLRIYYETDGIPHQQINIVCVC